MRQDEQVPEALTIDGVLHEPVHEDFGHFVCGICEIDVPDHHPSAGTLEPWPCQIAATA